MQQQQQQQAPSQQRDVTSPTLGSHILRFLLCNVLLQDAAALAAAQHQLVLLSGAATVFN